MEIMGYSKNDACGFLEELYDVFSFEFEVLEEFMKS